MQLRVLSKAIEERMVSYWLHVAFVAILSTINFIGKSTGGLLFDGMVVILAIFRIWQKFKSHGWSKMKVHIWTTVGEGVLIAVLAGVAVFVWEFLATPNRLQIISDGQKTAAEKEAVDWKEKLGTCSTDLKVSVAREKLLDGQILSQQGLINAQQGQFDTQ